MDIEHIKTKTYPMTALYVEDDDEVRTQTAKILKLFFNSVVECNNSYDGLKEFKKHSPDIVFTDINMSGINGLEMLDTIKNINPATKSIIFSAYDDTAYFTKAIEIGVDGYILKPFLISDLLNVLEKIINSDDMKQKNLICLDNGFVWDSEGLNLLKDNRSIRLTKNEIELLKMLLSCKERVAASEDIENRLFNDDICDNKRIRNIISRFNKKVDYQLIENIYSQGYKIRCQY
ncbi:MULTISPECIES: response regulator [unclassified Campylobacter]|uniref:response regulator transcription factor n=1 Tax=unclassified Campylobacter TaxID=2593542 RepID=UPI0014752BC4|nr:MULTISPECIES: response regulator [unclassified Campylobacter]